MVSIVEAVSASTAEGLDGTAWFNRWPADWPRRGSDPSDRRPDPPSAPHVEIVGDDLVVSVELPGVGPFDELYLARLGTQALEVWVIPRTQDGGAPIVGTADPRLLRVVAVPSQTAVADVDARYIDGIIEIRIRGGARRVERPYAERLQDGWVVETDGGG